MLAYLNLWIQKLPSILAHCVLRHSALSKLLALHGTYLVSFMGVWIWGSSISLWIRETQLHSPLHVSWGFSSGSVAMQQFSLVFLSVALANSVLSIKVCSGVNPFKSLAMASINKLVLVSMRIKLLRLYNVLPIKDQSNARSVL